MDNLKQEIFVVILYDSVKRQYITAVSSEVYDEYDKAKKFIEQRGDKPIFDKEYNVWVSNNNVYAIKICDLK